MDNQQTYCIAQGTLSIVTEQPKWEKEFAKE